ncbi:hypothetical protein ES705_50136 [subsurface metagenome]
MEIEGEDGARESDSLHYERTMLGEPMLLHYFFNDGGLIRVECTILGADIWTRLVAALESKYGEPMINEESLKKYGRNLTIHHKDGHGRLHENPNHAIDNLRVVCRGCHNKLHDRSKKEVAA